MRRPKYDERFEMLLRLRKPDEIFDLLCVANYFAGKFDANIPVEENRAVFAHIKKLLSKP